MTAATWPREDPREEKLLVVDAKSGAMRDAVIGSLAAELLPGDVVVVNDAATLPAALRGHTAAGDPIEARLAGEAGAGLFRAILFGEGDWHARTEDRPCAQVMKGDRLRFGGGLCATVVSLERGRLATLSFDAEGAALWRGIYAAGRPIQYSYLRAALPAWHAQTRFGSRPWAVESPSAGRPLTFDTMLALARRGIVVRSLTHAAGLSSTGDPELDARLPFPERYEIPPETVAAIDAARRVVAVGTTVVRALEDSALRHHGEVAAGEALAELVLGPLTERQVVDVLLTGMHEPGSSHARLLEAFAPRAVVDAAWRHAEGGGYLGHEFGDSMLLQGTTSR